MKALLFLLSAFACVLFCMPAHAQTYTQIYSQFGPLANYGLAFEPNPGISGSYPTTPDITDVGMVTDSSGGWTNVTANVKPRNVFVNAIANYRNTNTTPDGQPIQLAIYRYIYAVRLPSVPVASQTNPINAQVVHQMIQFWDGSNTLWQANKHTLEASIYWSLNPWQSDFGDIYVYTTDVNGNLARINTGIVLKPDTNWHVFDVRADLKNKIFMGIAVDNNWDPLTNVPLAEVSHPNWGGDLSLIFTAESMNCYPGPNATYVNSWTTQFKDVKLFRAASP
jgi:hypothetical protein